MLKFYGKNQNKKNILNNIYFHGTLEVINDSDQVYVSDKIDLKCGIQDVIAQISYHDYKAKLFVWDTKKGLRKGLIVSEDDGLANDFAYNAYRNKLEII